MRNHLTALLLLFIVLFYLWNSATTENDDESMLEGSSIDQEFDYFMTGVDSTSFAADGASQYRLLAERIVHYPDPEYATLDSPRLVIYELGANPWLLSASYGRIEHDPERDEEMLQLSEDVVIQHTDNNGQEQNIYTQDLTIYLDSRFLSTQSTVRLESGNRVISSTGMTADLNDRHLTFLGDVQGRYNQ